MFGKNITEMVLCPSLHLLGRPTVSSCPIVNEVNFDHLVKVMSTRFIHLQIQYFPLCTIITT